LVALCHRPGCPEQKHCKKDYVSHVNLQFCFWLWAAAQLIAAVHQLDPSIAEIRKNFTPFASVDD
jgi:hypothetical protein